MSDGAAEKTRFPDKKEVVSYARLAFAYADEAIELMPDDRLLAVAKDDPTTPIWTNVLICLEHLSRHLRMTESVLHGAEE